MATVFSVIPDYIITISAIANLPQNEYIEKKIKIKSLPLMQNKRICHFR